MAKNYSGRAAVVDKFLEKRPEETEAAEPSKTSRISGISGISRISRISGISKTDSPEATPPIYKKYCLRMEPDDIAYLKNASWENHQNVNEYIRSLIKADRAAKATKPKSRSKGGE